MSLTIVLERHLLPGSNLKIRFNAPSPGFSFQQRECTTSRREFVWKSFHSARIKFSPRMLSRFCFPAGFSPGSWRRVFFLAVIFPGKTGHLGGIPVSPGNLGGIPARSRCLFYKGSRQSSPQPTRKRVCPLLI